MIIQSGRSTLILILILFISGYSFAQQSKADDLYEAANQWVEKGEAQKAIKGYLNARGEYLKEKNYYRVLICSQNVAMYYQDTGDGQAAENLLLETIQVIPSNTNELIEIHASLQDNLAYTYLNLLNRLDDALKAYTESINLFEKAGLGNSTKQAFELINRSSTYSVLFQYELSVADMQTAISIYEKDEETTPEQLAEYYQYLGLGYYNAGEFNSALKNFQKAYDRIAELNASELKAKLYNNMGIALQSKGEYTKALEKFNEARVINEEQFGKDATHYAINLINIASVNKQMGDLDEAMKTFQEILLIYQKTPPEESSDLIDVIISIGEIADDFGLFADAQKLLDEAMTLATTNYGANSVVQADVYISFAVASFDRSEFDQSLIYNFKALSILQENKYPEGELYAMIYNNVGQAYDELNDIELALNYKTKALELYRKLNGPGHVSVAMAIGNIGLTYEMAEDYSQALDYLKQSIAIRLKLKDTNNDDLGTDYLNAGLVSLKKNDVRVGVEYLEKSKVIYDQYVKNEKKAMIYNRLAYGYQMLKNPSASKQCIQKAILANTLNFENENFEINPDKPDFIDYYELNLSYISKVDYYTRLGDKASLLKAIPLLEASDKVIKNKSVDLKNPKDRLELAQLNGFFTEAGMLLMDKLWQVTRDPAWIEKAFYYSERSKANELLADIQLSKAGNVSGISKKTLEKRSALTKRMSTLHQQIASAYGAKNQQLITKLKAEEFDLSRELELLQSEIDKESPRFGSLTSQRMIPSWNDLKKTLDDKTAIISYTITDSAKYILIGTKTKLVLKSIPPKTNLEKLIRGYINQIKYQSPGMKQMGGQLTEILWTPVENTLTEIGNIESIIILPEGPLNYLPFESLGKDHYLIERYTIRYQFSGALQVAAGEEIGKAKPSFIAMAPVFEDKETNFVNKSCERFVKATTRVDSTSRAFTLDGQYITPLPATEVEVSKINQIHLDKGLLSKHFLNEEASEELIKKGELATYDYVHLATHGFVNPKYPELSGLLLSQNPKSPEDGILYTGEILGLNFKASLVTLSACETALGKRIEGEGVRGLTTSFLLAGARNVVASLWKVADESTSQLMISFYNEILAGKDKATALRLAKQSLLTNEKYNHPYYWAPFIQIGSN